jgi:hypothetical protein
MLPSMLQSKIGNALPKLLGRLIRIPSPSAHLQVIADKRRYFGKDLMFHGEQLPGVLKNLLEELNRCRGFQSHPKRS